MGLSQKIENKNIIHKKITGQNIAKQNNFCKFSDIYLKNFFISLIFAKLHKFCLSTCKELNLFLKDKKSEIKTIRFKDNVIFIKDKKSFCHILQITVFRWVSMSSQFFKSSFCWIKKEMGVFSLFLHRLLLWCTSVLELGTCELGHF